MGKERAEFWGEEQSKVLGDDRKEKGRRRIACLTCICRMHNSFNCTNIINMQPYICDITNIVTCGKIKSDRQSHLPFCRVV